MDMEKPNPDEIAITLHQAGIPPKLTADQSKLLIKVLQLVAKGQPVTPEQVREIASRHQISIDDAISFLKHVSEIDGDRNIVGIFGLSQKDHPHRFQLKGYILSTWCAWDTLFLPPLLKQSANVESICPVTKDKILLTLSPENVVRHEPDNAVLSIVLPKPAEEGPRTAMEIWMIFCHHVFFFSSAEAASEWFKEKDYDPVICSIEEGYQIGRKAFEEIIKYV